MATAQWLPSELVLREIAAREASPAGGSVLLGQMWEDGRNRLFAHQDDRHLVTLAGSRAGKGRSLIIPNLLHYSGSVVCVDPKGENAAVTARYRRDVLGQRVVILDPFGVLPPRADLAPSLGAFNPFEWIAQDERSAIDDIAALADALIVRDHDKDPHWNENARAFLKGVMLFVMSLMPLYEPVPGQGVNWTLDVVRRLVSQGLPPPSDPDGANSLEGLLDHMAADPAFNGAIAAAGHLLVQMGDSERGGVLSTLRRHTEFLESPAMATALADSDFDPASLANTPTTIYLVLPEWRMGTHSRWLRVVITALMHALQRAGHQRGHPATLFILDEFSTLGHMESIERAAGYIAGFGVKLWLILQDLNQLKSLYAARWETFLGNAGTLTAFGNTDVTTLEYLSKRLGETEVIRVLQHFSEHEGVGSARGGLSQVVDAVKRGRIGGSLFGNLSENVQSGHNFTYQPSLHKTALITPDELARLFAREEETVLVHLAGTDPFRLHRIRYDLDEPFRERADPSPYY